MKRMKNRIISAFLSLVISAVPLGAVTASASEMEPVECILGDVNTDGKVSLKDASIVQLSTLELRTLTTTQQTLGDVDEKPGVSLTDAYLIQTYVTSTKCDLPKNTAGYSIGDKILVEYVPEPDIPDVPPEDTDSSKQDHDTDTPDVPKPDDKSSDTDSAAPYGSSDTEQNASDTETDTLPPVIPVPESDSEEPAVSDTDMQPVSDTDTASDTEAEASDIPSTDSEQPEPETDSDEPVVVRSHDEIVYDLDGGFERAAMGDAWILGNSVSGKKCLIESGSGINCSNCLKLTSESESLTFAVNRLSGLKPECTYKLTAKAWGDLTVSDEHHNGIFLQAGGIHSGWGVNRNEDGSVNYGEGAIFDSYNNWIQKSCGETTITVYFESTNKGLADIECALYGTGTAYFDDVTLTEVDYDSEPVDKIRVVTENIGLVLEKKDVEGISREQIQVWCDDVEWSYHVMCDLMGEAPFGGTRLYLISTYEPYMKSYQALSGINPIKWRGDYMSKACRRFCEEDIISDVAYHELAHLFDRLSYRWHFNTEFGAEYKKLYVLQQRGEGYFLNHGWGDRLRYDGLAEYAKSVSSGGYDKSIALRDGKDHYDGLNYVTYRATEVVGWDTVRAVFHDYCKYFDPRFTSYRARFDYFMMCLQDKYNETHPEATGFEVYDSFPPGEFEYIQDLIGKPGGEKERIYKVQFVDPDGKKLFFKFVPSGDSVSPPQPADSEQYGKFTGWDTDLSSVTSDLIVTAQYENFSFFGTTTVSTGSDKICEGEYASITASAPDQGTYQYDIICMKGSETLFESGYSSSPSAKVLIDSPDGYTVYTKIKDSSGRERMTNRAQFTAERAVVVYYSGFNNPNIHYRVGVGAWTAVPGVKMTANNDVAGYSYKYAIPISSSSTSVTLCFNDGNNNWDNNNQNDYNLFEGAYGIKNGIVTKLEK